MMRLAENINKKKRKKKIKKIFNNVESQWCGDTLIKYFMVLQDNNIAILGGKFLTYNFSILGCRRHSYKYIQWQLTEYCHMESHIVHRLWKNDVTEYPNKPF